MAGTRKINKAYLLDSVTLGVTQLFDAVFSGIFSSMEKEADIIVSNLETRTLLLQRKIMNRVAWSFSAGLALIFLFLSAYFYMTESQHMSRASTFMVLAVILLALSLAIKKFGGVNYAETEAY